MDWARTVMASTGLAPASAAPHTGSRAQPCLFLAPVPPHFAWFIFLDPALPCSTLAQSVSFKPCCGVVKVETTLAPLITGPWAEKRMETAAPAKRCQEQAES